MFRISLFTLVAASLLMPGIIGLHLHEDGTCHSHPFDDHDDEDADQSNLMLVEHRHTSSHVDARPVWFADDSRPNLAIPIQVLIDDYTARLRDPPRIRDPARIFAMLEPDSVPLFLRQRRILI